MDNWRCGFQNGMNLLGVMLVFSTFSDIFNAFIKPALEKRLGRKLSDWDRQAYLREMGKKAEFEAQQKIRRERQARMNDLKTIHDFVWNGSKANLM